LSEPSRAGERARLYAELDCAHLQRLMLVAESAEPGNGYQRTPGELRPIFVVGCPRSGSTVISECVGRHPEVAAVRNVEPTFLGNLFLLHYDLFVGTNRRGVPPLARMVSERDMIEAAGAYSDLLYAKVARAFGSALVLDHTPWYALVIDYLRRLYPHCRVVNVLRDGRSVVMSLGRSFSRGSLWAGGDVATRARLWRACVLATRTARARLGPEGWVDVHYEQLCADPVTTLRAVCAGLGLPFHTSVLDALAESHTEGTTSARCLAVRDETGVLRMRTRNEESGWPSEWTLQERLIFQATAGSLLDAVGGGVP
jgi:hypothetical protein